MQLLHLIYIYIYICLQILCFCSHFIVPELGPNTKFSYSSHKAVNEYKEAKAV
jgi:hypothetical protein